MAAVGNYLRHKLLDLVLRNTAYSSPATVYVALYTSDPTNGDTGTEVTGGSYVRQAVTFGAPTTAGATDNTGLLTFPTATANWGTVTHLAIRDASTAGNLLFYGALNSSRVMLSGDAITIASGALDVSLGGALGNYLRQALINHVLRNSAYSQPATVYAALYTSDPTNADSGTEVTGGSYAREAASFVATSAAGATDNSGTITFPTATANWGTVVSAAIRDAAAAGNLLFYGSLSAARTILSGDIGKFNIGDLDVSLA